MSERSIRPPLALWPLLDALAAWLLLGWLGQRLGWSLASGLLPVALWWALRCVATAWPQRLAAWSPWLRWAVLSLLAALAATPSGPAAMSVLLLASALWGTASGARLAAMGRTEPSLPGLAMGLMMGSLWLASRWCLGPGWTDAQAVALHLGLMLVTPLILSLLRSARVLQRPLPAWWPLVLLAGGALGLAWPDSADVRLPSMGLLALAWAMAVTGVAPRSCRGLRVPSGLGPILLLGIGLLAPTLGPTALQMVWWAVAALALVGAWRLRTPHAGPTLSSHRWSDVS